MNLLAAAIQTRAADHEANLNRPFLALEDDGPGTTRRPGEAIDKRCPNCRRVYMGATRKGVCVRCYKRALKGLK